MESEYELASLNELNSLTSFGLFGDLVVAVVTIGIVTMAIIQIVKDIFLVRFIYQRKFISKWFQDQSKRVKKDLVKYKINLDKLNVNIKQTLCLNKTDDVDEEKLAREALARMESLAMPVRPTSLYHLHGENLVGQLSAAMQIVLDNPREYCDLVCVFCSSAGAKKILKVLEWKKVIRPKDASDEESAQDQELAEALNHLNAQAQRHLDSIQVLMSRLWRKGLQIFAVVVGVIVAFAVGFAVSAPEVLLSYRDFFVMVIVGAVGGSVATLVRDFTVSLQSVRRRER